MTTTLQPPTIDQRVINKGTSVLESASEVLQYLSTKSPSHVSNGSSSAQQEFEEDAILEALHFIPERTRPQVRLMLSPHEAALNPIIQPLSDKVVQNHIAAGIVLIQSALWASQQGSQYQR